MKFQFPKLKFPNTLLAIWWGLAMMAGLATYLLKETSYLYPAYPDELLPQKYLIMLVILGYFVAVQVLTLKCAIQHSATAGSLMEKWHTVMTHTRFWQLSSILPMLFLPFILSQTYVIPSIDNNWIELIIAPGTHSISFLHPYRLTSYVGYFAFGMPIAYLHIRVLAAWLTMMGLAFRLSHVGSTLVIVLGISILIGTATSKLLEPTIYDGWGKTCGYNEVYSNNFSKDCGIYWNYRNINRVVESVEYSLYGTLSGGVQFINTLKLPIMYYDNKEQLIINWEFLRNLVAGILSPSLQLFFIMRYLKKRSFEKAKRGA